jgi:hypothetical protein
MIVEPCYLCGTVTLRTVIEETLDYEYFMCADCQHQDLVSMRQHGHPYIPPNHKEKYDD